MKTNHATILNHANHGYQLCELMVQIIPVSLVNGTNSPESVHLTISTLSPAAKAHFDSSWKLNCVSSTRFFADFVAFDVAIELEISNVSGSTRPTRSRPQTTPKEPRGLRLKASQAPKSGFKSVDAFCILNGRCVSFNTFGRFLLFEVAHARLFSSCASKHVKETKCAQNGRLPIEKQVLRRFAKFSRRR